MILVDSQICDNTCIVHHTHWCPV